jgi:hypothetical protein
MCTANRSFGLTLAGETRFFAIPLGPIEVRYESANLTLLLSLVESGVLPPDELSEFRLTWKGNFQDALTAGQLVVK